VPQPSADTTADITSKPTDYDVSVQAGDYSTTLGYHHDLTMS
jgi:hypothetical protein